MSKIICKIELLSCFVTNFNFSLLFSVKEEKVQQCLGSLIEIIRFIYLEVKFLEQLQLPEQIESNYDPLEDLNDCIYFQRSIKELSEEDIKVSRVHEKLIILSKPH